MLKSYSEQRRVQLGEIGPGGTLKIPSLFNHLQGVTGAHSHSIGFGTADMLKEGLTWIISRYRLSIEKMPRLFDHFTVQTWRSGESGNFAVREFLVTDDKSNILIRGTSSWMLLDFIKMKPLAPSQRYPGYPVYPERAIDDSFESMPVTGQAAYEKEFTIRRNDLDINNHVNNSYYIAWILETGEDINEGLRPVDISINFRGEARYGDTVLSRVSYDGGPHRLIHSLTQKSTGKELTRGITEWR